MKSEAAVYAGLALDKYYAIFDTVLRCSVSSTLCSKMKSILYGLALPSVLGLATRQSSPSANIANGTVNGYYQPTYNQDLFLGIPFAQPPVGDLRFRLPQPINESWSEPLSATAYYPECVGYGGDQIGYEVNEDCLALNIVRPAGYEGQQLPVGVWIHGGGYVCIDCSLVIA